MKPLISASNHRRVLIVGIDGLRPDLVNPDVMPCLTKLVDSGTRASDYHSVYPTHTRAINTTLATGCHPGKHGWVANVFRFDGATEDGIINTAEAAHVNALDAATRLNAIEVPTLGDILARCGKRMGLATTQASGASLIWTRKQHYPIATVSSTYGRADIQQIWDQIGDPQDVDAREPDKVHHIHWAKRAVIDFYLDDSEAEVILFYMIEPDFSQHYYGLGAPQVSEALRECDRALGEVLDAMDQRGIRDQFDIIVMSDHGHSTTIASRTLAEHLDRARRASGVDSPHLTTASDYIYPAPGGSRPTASEIEPIVRWIQEQEWTGAVFGADEYASLPGVVPLSILWGGIETDRAPLLAINPAWSDAANDFGIPGTLAALTEQVALRSTHGSCSPYDMHAFWAGNGPGFREGVVSDLPAGATDLVPTVLSLLGIDPPPWVDGRVMAETLSKPDRDVPDAMMREIMPGTAHPNGFEPVLELHQVGHTTYIHRVLNGHNSACESRTKGYATYATE